MTQIIFIQHLRGYDKVVRSFLLLTSMMRPDYLQAA